MTLRSLFSGRRDVTERRMFGGIAFMVGGHMTIGVSEDRLMVRVGADDYQRALGRPHARPMDFTGRPLRGFVYVDHGGVRTSAQVAYWLNQALRFTASLPPK